MGTSERQLARLTVAAEESVVVPVRDFVNGLLTAQGVPADQLQRLDLVVEEACLLVIQTAFDPGEHGEFDIIVLRRPNQVVVALEDRGLPRDLDEAAASGEAQLGLVLMRAFADEVVFRNLGKHGKRIELIKALPGTSVADQLATESPLAADPPVATDNLTLRLMTAEDAMPLARCIYRSYGYTYPNDLVYYPGKMVELIEGGQIVSCVAINESGQVVGHVALQFARPGDKVPESGIAVVDPRYRGRKLFESMKAFLADWAARNGIYGLISEAVAVHPYSQKGNLSLGASETGVLLGYLPVGMEFRSIKGGAEARRQSAVMFYLSTTAEPERDVFVPSRHRAIAQRIYDKVPLRRVCREVAATLSLDAAGEDFSVIVHHLKPELGLAFIRIDEYGRDVLALIQRHLRDLCLRKFDCIILDLPLSRPLTAVLCGAFEALGFSFAGIGVELCDGDSLRLLYLNNIEVDTQGLVVVSEHGKALADYVLAARASAGMP